ncbi:telomere-associated protein Tap [Streptomyces rapamycinicus]|uniref:Transcriptional regulator n=2 Tax=Streptomyces rapamycinicus TaxID=1226757 RepID=A0A0A0N565_STRRN|nr:helix-turn-helix transcriptional regulator [Streptomyces rapamycinicus]AGP51936.1 transcriptional regulator [Streptomyces rapamycinicus NRRL 5491]MBB4779357.1 DNA-binding XRE family transcriptional regulator [Streptomyces rapamycinicus]RLV75980.1 transcriptional regulator [Streptomyces rapamycinicus NRRL 5491]UTP28140.1 helix-turn-helix domain-containing protein [Streptomyces rapamycinicus NRRL 5491]
MSSEEELFGAVDALLEQAALDPLPEPAERKRLREAAGLTQEQIANALRTRREAVGSWEAGRTDPRPPKRAAYARLLEGLAARFPAPRPTDGTSAAAESPTSSAMPAMTAPENTAPRAATAPATAARPAATPGPTSTSRRPGTRKAAPAGISADGIDPRFENGPLAVVDADADGQVLLAYCVGGLVLDVPAKSIPALVEWTLKEAKLGQPKLSGPGKDADPLLVLTEAALERYGLPVALTDEERLAGRIPGGHKVIKQLTRGDWQLTKRGFGPWARIYRPAKGSERQCVQLCIPSWNALDSRHWGHAAQLPPAELARLLGAYAARVMTPRGSTAVTGLELMTALHPPTYAVRDEATGGFRKADDKAPGSLGEDPVACAPCEAPDGHPLLADLPRFHVRGPGEKLFEEAYDWARPMTDAECTLRYLVGIDVNMAFAAGANGLVVGLGAPTHVKNPVFDAKLPGSWLVDLSHVDLSRVKVGKDKWADLDAALLPSPFTPKGERPDGPAWYATPTVAYAVELGYDVAPSEAYVRYDNGRYLDGWYNRLRDAYLATMADLGVGADLAPADFLTAMDGYKERDPELAIVVSAIKATVKGGLGKLRERPRGEGWRPGETWRALSRPTWRPDIRAAVISRTRINLHRKIVKHAAFTGQYPVAVLSDCVVYAADGTSPLDFLPYRDGKPLPGGFKLGINPGLVKHEGTQTVLWGEGVREQFNAPELNLARYIKDGTVTDVDNGE